MIKLLGFSHGRIDRKVERWWLEKGHKCYRVMYKYIQHIYTYIFSVHLKYIFKNKKSRFSGWMGIACTVFVHLKFTDYTVIG